MEAATLTYVDAVFAAIRHIPCDTYDNPRLFARFLERLTEGEQAQFHDRLQEEHDSLDREQIRINTELAALREGQFDVH